MRIFAVFERSDYLYVFNLNTSIMAKYMSMEHLKFLLFDVHHFERLLDTDRYKDYDKASIEILLNSAKDFSDKELWPIFREMDEKPAHYKDGGVIVHPALGKIIKMAGENGYIGSSFSYEDGGMQMPATIHIASSHIMESANNHVPGYYGLTTGAAGLIVTFASQELKDKYVPKMLAGDWSGTMALTEPQAGSSLSDITTTAYPQPDGTYKIKGQKIFISGGDHQHSDNFVHLTLARIEGAPAGTRGISLFVVPKNRIKEDGSLEFNDVITAGDFQKMGQKGYCTTHLSYGESDDCIGEIVGNEHMGLKYMFQMMNGARIDVGLTAASTATAAFYASLQYAKERPQGRRLSNGGQKDLNKGQTLIINHPDVRRMLFLQQAIVEGSLSLLVECGILEDTLKTSPDGEEKTNAHLLIELLLPIAKTYPSEAGQRAINNGLQILGGYGFTEDFVLQQYYRDIRIMALYEGTTGIQSLDLLGRKMTMANGAAAQQLMGKIGESIAAASKYDELKKYAEALGDKMQLTQEVFAHLLQFAMSGNHERFLSDATIFMEFAGDLVIGWQWLKMATVAKEALITGNKTYDASFYEQKIHLMKFFFKYELPKMNTAAEILKSDEVLTIVNDNEVSFA